MEKFNLNRQEVTVYTNDYDARFPGNQIHYTAIIGPNVTMGTGNYIGPYCVIGMPGEHRERWGEDKGVLIGNRCVITGHVTIDAGIEGLTMVGDNIFVMKHAHIGHDAVIYPNVTISCGAKIGGHTIVQVGANIGLNAVIHQRHSIAANVMVAMGAVVTLKCQTQEDFMYAGNPAVEKGRNKKAPVNPCPSATPVQCAIHLDQYHQRLINLGVPAERVSGVLGAIHKIALASGLSLHDAVERIGGIWVAQKQAERLKSLKANIERWREAVEQRMNQQVWGL